MNDPKGTVWIHFIFVIAIGAKEYFGTPILCDNTSNDVSCFTFTGPTELGVQGVQLHTFWLISLLIPKFCLEYFCFTNKQHIHSLEASVVPDFLFFFSETLLSNF